MSPRATTASNAAANPPTVQHMLDAMPGCRRSCATAGSTSSVRTASAAPLYSGHFDGATQPANTARFVFLDPAATTFYVDWDRVAN